MGMGSHRPLLCLLCFLLLCHVAAGAGGPCTSSIITINIGKQSDFSRRTSLSPRQTVNLVLQSNLTLTSFLHFDSSFSCTILSAAAGTQRRISVASQAFPALFIQGANNVLVRNIDFSVSTTSASAACLLDLPDTNSDLWCPTVYIHSSWAVQLVQGRVKGRIEVVKSPQTTLDSLTISSFSEEPTLVSVSLSGDGPRLIKNDVTISNSFFTGGRIHIFVGVAAVGTSIRNNNFKNPAFTGIQCGSGVHIVGDCMLSSFVNNFVQFTQDFTPVADASALYFGTHWVNPGNYLSCNYVVGGKQCLYLDYCSSGVTVEGMVCYNVTSGLKLNTGHSNKITSFLDIGARLPGWFSCQNYVINNCNKDPGSSWDSTRRASYNSLTIRQRYPWLNNFCNLTAYNGVNCNPPGSVPASMTGNCSGLPTGNKASFVIVDGATKNTPTYLSCANITSVTKLNSQDWGIFTSRAVKFNNLGAQDFGLQASSPVFSLYPSFKSCPKSANGPRPVAASSYTTNFNVAKGPAAALL